MDRRALIAQAKTGDADAIATLISQSLAHQGLTVRAARHSYRLTLYIEGNRLPPQASTVDYLRRGMAQLQIAAVGTVLVQAQVPAAETPAWSEEFSLLGVSVEGPAKAPEAPSAVPEPASRRPAYARSAVRPQPQPLVIRWSDFDPLKLGIVAVIAVYGALWSLAPSYGGWQGLLHWPNLAIHETGHLLFMPFGRFLTILGGSLTQILVPAGFTIYFFLTHQRFSSAVTLFWSGQNFMDVAIYMGDAPYRQLPLTVDNIDAHDWWNLFNMLGCLNQAGLIAGLTHALGVGLYLASVAAGVWLARVDADPLPPG